MHEPGTGTGTGPRNGRTEHDTARSDGLGGHPGLHESLRIIRVHQVMGLAVDSDPMEKVCVPVEQHRKNISPQVMFATASQLETLF